MAGIATVTQLLAASTQAIACHAQRVAVGVDDGFRLFELLGSCRRPGLVAALLLDEQLLNLGRQGRLVASGDRGRTKQDYCTQQENTYARHVLLHE